MNFKLYHIDIDNDPRNEKEYVFYGEGKYDPKRKIAGYYADYKLIDLQKCSIRTAKSVSDKVDAMTKRRTGSLNGIILYKDKYYIFDLTYFDKEDVYSLWLYGWKKEKGIMLSVCSFEPKRN